MRWVQLKGCLKILWHWFSLGLAWKLPFSSPVATVEFSKFASILNVAEIDVFLELACFFHDPVDVGNLISGFSAFSKTSLNIWKFTIHLLLNFEHHFTSVWDEGNCVVVWAFFGIAFLWDWNENWPFPVLWPLLSFPNFAGILSAALSQNHLLRSEVSQLQFHRLF